MKGVWLLLQGLGNVVSEEALRNTPERVARFWEEFLNAYPEPTIKVFTEPYATSLVLIKDITFYSICEHHLLPFVGKAHVGYLPDNGRVIGLSKVPRIVRHFASRPQLQERFTEQVADYLWETLKPKGVIVVTTAVHYCMVMRGVRTEEAETTVAALRGDFLTEDALRAEAYNLIVGKTR